MGIIYISQKTKKENYEKLIELLKNNEMTIKELEDISKICGMVIRDILKKFEEIGALKIDKTNKNKGYKYSLIQDIKIEIVFKKNQDANIDYNNIIEIMKKYFKEKKVKKKELVDLGAKINYPYSTKILISNAQNAGIEVIL